jgi:WD40 repeat protein
VTGGETGPSDGGGRRFLLTGVVSRYAFDPSWNREELAEDLERVVALFGELGYEHVPLMGLDPTWLQVQDALRDFATSPARRPGDYVVVYLAGHGDVLAVGATGAEHVLLPADAIPADPYRRVIKSGDLAQWMLAGTKVRRLLLLMDTCFSGQGGIDFGQNAAAWAGSWARADDGAGAGVVVVSATCPRQEAMPGAFTQAFAKAVGGRAAAGHIPGRVPVDAVVSVMNADPGLPASQRAQWAMVAGTGKIPDFLPNPRRDAALADLTLAEQAQRWSRQDEEDRRAQELRGQFVPRTSGFTGRAQALADLSRWVEDAADARPAVVTGDPGSGKTAVLGLLAALSDPQRRPTIPRDRLPAGIIPGPGLIDVAIYAGNLTVGQVLAGLAAAAGIEDLDPDPAAFDLSLARLLAALADRDLPLTAMIDSLDETTDPPGMVGRLLRPLIERGKGMIRLLLGTRRHVCDRLGPAWPRSCLVVDLDAAHYADPDSLTEVVRRTLRHGLPDQGAPSPFATCPPEILDDVTAAIAAAAGRSFFVASILAAAQVARPALPDPASLAWQAGLPREAGQAMQLDLEARLGGDADRALGMLRPLAYAQEAGLPWEGTWAALATALDPGQQCTNEDLLQLTARAGAYIAEGGTVGDRSLYRLYHRSLVEYLLGGRDQAADQQAITTALARLVPRRPNGRPDWPAAHPYTRDHLAAHAAACGMIDDLAQDPGFLLAASPPRLLNALTRTASEPARAAAGAYRRALPHLRAHPAAEHPAYLALAARCSRAPALADRITADGLTSPWQPLWASWQPHSPHQVITGHSGLVQAVAVAKLDGRPVVVSASNDRSVRVWDLATGVPVGSPLAGHGGDVYAVAVGELDGRPVVVSGGGDQAVRVWDLATGAPVGSPLAGHGGPVHAVAVGELDGRPVVVSGSGDQTIRVWDLATGAPVGSPLAGHRWSVNAVAVAELDSRPVVVSASSDQTIRVWDLATGVPVGSPLAGHRWSVNAVAVAELDSRPVVVSASNDQTIRVWDLATGALVGSPLTGHSWSVNAVAVAELDSRPVVVSASNDQTIRVWDLATGAPVGSPLTGHSGPVKGVAVAEIDGRPVVVSGSSDQSVGVWDLAAAAPIGDPFTGHSDWVRAVAVAEIDGRPVVVSASNDQTIRVWDLATGAPVGSPLVGHGGDVYAVAVGELDGRPVVVSGGGDQSVRVWDLATGVPVGSPLAGHGWSVYAVAVGELDGRPVVVSGSGDQSVRVWDLATGALVGSPLAGHGGSVYAVAVGELDGRPVVVSGSGDQAVRVWDLATGVPVGSPLTGHSEWVQSVAVAELDGRPVVVSGGGDQSVRVWDLATGALVGSPLAGHGGPVHAVAVAELAGRPVVVSGSADQSVRVWDLTTGTLIGDPFAGHVGPVYAVGMAELDGRPVVVSGGGDQSVRVWDLATGVPVGSPLTGHSWQVNTVVATELDGRPVVISASNDQSVRVWDLATGAPVGDTLTGHGGPVYAMAVGEIGGRPVVVSGGADQSVRVWDLAGNGSARVLGSLPGSVHSIILTAGSPRRTRADLNSARAVICAADRAFFLEALASPQPSGWKRTGAIQLDGQILAAAWHQPNTLIVGTEAGIAVLRTTQALHRPIRGQGAARATVRA